MYKFNDVFEFQKKSRIKAGDGRVEGRHPFYTSSVDSNKYVDEALFDRESLVFGTGGNASVHYAQGDFSVSTDCLVAQSKTEDVNTKFVYYYLSGNIRILEQGFKGAGLKHISKSYISDISFPKFSRSKQNKIVKVLDTADGIRQKRKEQLIMLDDYLKFVFFDMFGDPVLNSKNWEKKKLEEISDIQGGVQVSHKRSVNPIEVSYLRVANVYRDSLVLDEIKTIRVTESELIRTKLKAGDVLIVEGHGNREEIGRTAVWDGSVETCIHQNHLIRIRVDRNVVLPIFLSNYINSDGGRRQLFSMGKTTSGLNTISASNVKSLEIMLPSIGVQQKYQSLLNKAEMTKQKMRASLDEMDNHFNALTQRYFG